MSWHAPAWEPDGAVLTSPEALGADEPETNPWDSHQQAPPDDHPHLASVRSGAPDTVPDSPSRRRLRDRLLTRAQLADLPQPEPLIEDTVDRNSVLLLAGYRATGKSFIALDWSCCVAKGHAWLSRPVEPGRVLYVASEGAEGMDNRVSAWEHAWQTPVPVGDELRFYPEPIRLDDPSVIAELSDVCREDRVDLLVIDTLARSAVGLDENSARDMGLVVDAVDRLKRASRAAVVVVHHTGKDPSGGARGSSALEAGVDTVYTTEGDAQHIKLIRTKRKDGPTDDAHTLRLRPVLDSAVPEFVRGQDRRLGADTLRTVFADNFADTGASKAELRTVADLPPATFHRAVNTLVNAGAFVNEGTDKRPFYRRGPEW